MSKVTHHNSQALKADVIQRPIAGVDPQSHSIPLSDGRSWPLAYITALCESGASQKTISDILDLSDITLRQLIWSRPDGQLLDFNTVYRSSYGRLQSRLQLKARELGLSGNVQMLIFLLKNYCGMSDKVESNVQHSGSVSIDILDQIAESEDPAR